MYNLPVVQSALASSLTSVPTVEHLAATLSEHGLREVLTAVANHDATDLARSMLVDMYVLHLHHLEAAAATERFKVINFDCYGGT